MPNKDLDEILDKLLNYKYAQYRNPTPQEAEHEPAIAGYMTEEGHKKAKQEILSLVLEALPEKEDRHNLMCPVAYRGFQEDQCNCGTTVKNKTIDEAEANIRKVLG